MNVGTASEPAALIDLCEARIGAKLRVRSLQSKPAVCQRLREMGFCELAEIHKVADNGALICQVCGSRVALSRSLAREILVEPLLPLPFRIGS
jgi:ferrous iron transport protein A